MASVFRNVIEFMGQIGVYDVVLPFLLIFTILFAILEKSKVFGEDKRSLNSLTSFVVGFLVIASSQVVAIINQAVSQIMILLVLAVFFMVLVGSFFKEGEEIKWPKRLKWGSIGVLGVAMVLIFLNAVKLRSGVSILEYLYSYVISNSSGTVVGTVIFLAIVVGAMAWIVRNPSGGESS